MKKNVIIHYPYIPEYRMGIFRLLNSSENFKYTFWVSNSYYDKFMKLGNEKELNHKLIKTRAFNLPFSKGVFEIQIGAIKRILTDDIDIYIPMANPYSPTMWITVIIARMRGIKVLNWTHGYLRKETGIKSIFKKMFFKLFNGQLLYGNNSKNIMLEMGFDANNLDVIYNSLDYSTQKRYREQLTYDDRIKTRNKLKLQTDSIVLIAIGRLMTKLKIDQIIKIMNVSEKNIELIIVGDGPEKNNLQNLVKNLNLEKKVLFYGGCHEEEEISKLYNASDYSVVMGKVGLSAMHSLAYGIPMITNNNMTTHFPEIEAIIDNFSGLYFEENNYKDFINKINKREYHDSYYSNCIEIIEKFYVPEKQKYFIENAIKKYIKIKENNS